jgi:hypothetical protein
MLLDQKETVHTWRDLTLLDLRLPLFSSRPAELLADLRDRRFDNTAATDG